MWQTYLISETNYMRDWLWWLPLASVVQVECLTMSLDTCWQLPSQCQCAAWVWCFSLHHGRNQLHHFQGNVTLLEALQPKSISAQLDTIRLSRATVPATYGVPNLTIVATATHIPFIEISDYNSHRYSHSIYLQNQHLMPTTSTQKSIQYSLELAKQSMPSIITAVKLRRVLHESS